MGRRRCRGRVSFRPTGWGFVPISGASGVVELEVEELEAIRLADLEGLYQEEASRLMGVSRATFGRILEGARRKVAEALVEGKALRLKEDEPDRPQEMGPRRGCGRGTPWRGGETG